MNLDRVCARPGAGAALLTLHRWLPHGVFEVKQAFRGSVIAPWVSQCASELTAFIKAVVSLTDAGRKVREQLDREADDGEVTA